MLIRLEGNYSPRFINFLIKIIKNRVITKLSLNKLKAWDKYLDTINKNHESAKEIILISLSELVYVIEDNYIIITINNNYVLSKLHLKLIDAIKLINFGNMEIKGYPIISDTFQYVEKNIKGYEKRFHLFGGI